MKDTVRISLFVHNKCDNVALRTLEEFRASQRKMDELISEINSGNRNARGLLLEMYVTEQVKSFELLNTLHRYKLR